MKLKTGWKARRIRKKHEERRREEQEKEKFRRHGRREEEKPGMIRVGAGIRGKTNDKRKK